MTARPVFGRARATSDEDRPPHAMVQTPRLIVFAATLVLAAATGLPLGSVATLIPQADDPAGPFLGI